MSVISSAHVIAFSHDQSKVGLYLLIIGCQRFARFGLSNISFLARLNSSITHWHGIPSNWGSIGQRFDCFHITISFEDSAIIVPADIHICGTMTLMSFLNIA